MMIRRMILSMVLFCCLPANGMALEVAEAVVTTRIEDRAPVDAIQAYTATVGKLYCFTRVTGAAGDTAVVHVWSQGGAEEGRVELPVRSGDWRTWSAKTIPPGAAGDWRVDVLDAEGNVLKTTRFTLN